MTFKQEFKRTNKTGGAGEKSKVMMSYCVIFRNENLI